MFIFCLRLGFLRDFMQSYYGRKRGFAKACVGELAAFFWMNGLAKALPDRLRPRCLSGARLGGGSPRVARLCTIIVVRCWAELRLPHV
jgi:hypothetical protein